MTRFPVRTFRAPRVEKPWGHELIFAALDGRYVGKVISVQKGHSLSLQFHERKEETISLLSGAALVSYGTDVSLMVTETFAPGDTIHLPPGTAHRITALQDLVFVECSTADPGWQHDVVRLEDAYGRAGTTAP